MLLTRVREAVTVTLRSRSRSLRRATRASWLLLLKGFGLSWIRSGSRGEPAWIMSQKRVLVCLRAVPWMLLTRVREAVTVALRSHSRSQRCALAGDQVGQGHAVVCEAGKPCKLADTVLKGG